MEDATVGGPKATRWLAWAVAAVLTAGVVSAATVASADKGGDARIVRAAGDSTGGVVDVPTTASPFVAPLQPPEIPTTTSTAPPAPAPKPVVTPATNPPVRAPVTTARPTTTTTPAPVSATTTPATVSGRATVTIVSQYALDVDVTLNGRVFRVAANGQVGPIDLALAANGKDIVEVRVVSRPTCGEGDAGGYFQPGGSYRLLVVSTPGMCLDIAGPNMKSTPA